MPVRQFGLTVAAVGGATTSFCTVAGDFQRFGYFILFGRRNLSLEYVPASGITAPCADGGVTATGRDVALITRDNPCSRLPVVDPGGSQEWFRRAAVTILPTASDQPGFIPASDTTLQPRVGGASVELRLRFTANYARRTTRLKQNLRERLRIIFPLYTGLNSGCQLFPWHHYRNTL